MNPYAEYDVEWRGFSIKIRHCSNWLSTSSDFITQHIEVIAEDRQSLPITSTGYRSCFLNGAAAISDWDDDPVRITLDWLDNEARSKGWQGDRQLSLF